MHGRSIILQQRNWAFKYAFLILRSMSTLPVLTSCTLRCASLIVFIYVLFQVPHPVDLNSVRVAVMLTAIEATAARSSNARSHAATFAPISVFDLFESLWEVEPALQLYSSVLQIFTGLQKDFSYSFSSLMLILLNCGYAINVRLSTSRKYKLTGFRTTRALLSISAI